ncbi:MAG: glycosyltransferase [Candidatus Thorarchaeota archaeon]|nr:glycosyltransferase [Candidatus Thorarchaeota archaeon]
MRILHTSHTGLPDPRIEKTALTMKKDGHELVFLGGKSSDSYNSNIFDRKYHVPIPNSFMVVNDFRFRRKWIKTINEISPDIVHAHNIIAAAMMLGADYPTIYDDHEYWSKQTFKYSSRGIVRRTAAIPLIRAIPRWERRLLEAYPVVTVSDMNARDHRRYAKHVTVTRNFPQKSELESLDDKSPRVGNVYVGNDFILKRFLDHRNMTGLRDIIELDYLAGLPHHEMMIQLTSYRVGFTPWLPHPLHEYADPNKHYEYLGAGLQVVVSRSLYGPLKDAPYVHPFDDYSEIPDIIANLPNIPSSEIMAHAKEHYVWENQASLIHEVYRYALSL